MIQVDECFWLYVYALFMVGVIYASFHYLIFLVILPIPIYGIISVLTGLNK